MLGETACNKRVVAWAAANFVTSGVRWKPTVFIKKHKWPSKDAGGPADHFRGRMDSIGQDLRG